jgi:hypothetical protein
MALALLRPMRLALAGLLVGVFVNVAHARVSERASAQLQDLKKSAGSPIYNTKNPHNGCAASVLIGSTKNGAKLVVRRTNDAEQARRLHAASFQLADEIGATEMILPAAVYEAKEGEAAGPRAMVTPFAGDRFQPANQAPAEWRQRISEPQRLKAAFLDLLTHHQDRIPKNLMLAENGEVRLIDQDNILGHLNDWRHNSMFWPGGEAAYQTKQASVADLGPAEHKLVDKLSAMAAKDVAHEYSVTEEEGRVMRNEARRIQRLGLSGAVEEYKQEGQRPLLLEGGKQPANDNGYERKPGELIRAIAGRSRPGHMMFGPYRKFTKGPISVGFDLRMSSQIPANVEVVHLDIVDAATGAKLGERRVKRSELSGDWRRITVKANVPTDDNKLEFRAWWHGHGDLDAGQVHVD